MSDDAYQFVVRELEVELGGADDAGVRTGSTTIDVTSRLKRHDNVMLRIEPGEGASASWFTVDPDRQFLQIDATMSTTLSVAIPADAGPGSYSFRLGAYAETDQQRDFALGQELTVVVPEPKPDDGSRPWPLIAAVAGALVVVGLVAALMLRGGDDETEDDAVTEPQALLIPTTTELIVERGQVPNLVGLPLDQVAEAFSGTVETFADADDPSADQCVLIQYPPAGTETETVALFTTACPQRSPQPQLPGSFTEECVVSFDFCELVSATYENPITDSEWQESKSEMALTFTEAFTIPSASMPGVIGLPIDEARAALLSAGLMTPVELDDSSDPNSTGCSWRPVLLQHPFPGELVALDGQITLVLTGCTTEQNRPQQVEIASGIALDDYGNLRGAVPAFAAALAADEGRPEDYLGSEAMKVDLDGMIDLFRRAFANRVVPELVGIDASDAVVAVRQVELRWQTPIELNSWYEAREVAGTGQQCFDLQILDQDTTAGTPIADLPEDHAIVMTMGPVERPCLDGENGLASMDAAANAWNALANGQDCVNIICD